MAHEAFDPIAVEAEMVKVGFLPPRADVLPSLVSWAHSKGTSRRRIFAGGRCGESQ